MERSVIRERRCKRRYRSRIALRSIRATKPGTEERKTGPTPGFLLSKAGFAFDVIVFCWRAINLRFAHDEDSGAKERREARALAMKVRSSWHNELPLPRGERVGVRGFGLRSKYSDFRTPSSCPSPPSARLRASSTRYGGEGTQRRGRVTLLTSRERSRRPQKSGADNASRTRVNALMARREGESAWP